MGKLPVLMARKLPTQAIQALQRILTRMGLMLNEQKTRLVSASNQPFDFPGLTVRYDRDLQGRAFRYWNITPSKKSEQKIRDKIRKYLNRSGHLPPEQVAKGLNQCLHGWLNYFHMEGISYSIMSKRRLRHYMTGKLHRYYGRKSQRKSRLYRQNAFEVLTCQYGLIDPTKYSKQPARL